MKQCLIMILLILALASSINIIFSQELTAAEKPLAGRTVSPRCVIVDDYKGTSTYRPWYYSCIGTDRGAILSDGGSRTVTIGGGTAIVEVQSGWAGVWTALIHLGEQNEEINPAKLLGPYIKDQYQPYITGVQVDITEGSGQFKIELKNGLNEVVTQETFYLTGGPRTLEFSVTPTANISKLNWLVDGVGSAVVDEVRLVIASPTYSVAEAVFLFSYGHLCQCYDESSGLVRDRARWPVEDFAAVQCTGTFALATAIAYDLGYIDETSARTIIQKTKGKILALPVYKGLLPHFLENGDIVVDTEWSSIDTAITLTAEILACQAIGEETSSLESLLAAIDWADLTANGSQSIGMGYDYFQNKLGSRWDTFGSEALLAAIAYCAATGDNNVLLEKYHTPPTWDGSGFNDEMAALFFPATGTDIWKNDWSAYRQKAFADQFNYFTIHQTYSTNGLFGLSAAEVPEPWVMANEDDQYKAWGIGGHNHEANDGTALVGYPVVAPHYAALAAAEHPQPFEDLFYYLMAARGIFTPLNNAESCGLDPSGNIRWNSLKGSWNLSLQALGAARLLSTGNYLPYRALNDNDFLQQGFIGIMQTSLDVTFPNGGEELEVGTLHDITWEATGLVGNIKIEYSTDQGGHWTEIIASTENDGSHPWTVPAAISSRCLLRVSDVDGVPADTSDTVFTIFAPAITVVSPDGGEVWEVGSQQTLAWTSTGAVGNVKIEYSVNNGDNWTVISAVAENGGSYPWTVPDTISNQCLLRVSGTDGSPTDTGDNVFSIVGSPSLTVLYPNGGETLYVGSRRNIAWNSSGLVGDVKIEYSTTNGDTWIEIIASTANDGWYSWVVPAAPSGQCLVRIGESGGDTTDTSNHVFTIETMPTLTVSAPNGGEEWQAGSTHTITWTSEGNIGNVLLEYCADGGNSWTAIARSEENDGSYSWRVPDSVSGNCLVRISANDEDQGISDSSDAVFSITPAVIASITVTSPNGGEAWAAGSTREITWTATGIDQVPQVTIEYSPDRGDTWTTIVPSVPNAADGSYNWAVPAVLSENCLVRVRGTEKDGAPADISDGVFSILPWQGLMILSPNGGEVYQVGKVYIITWTSAGPVDEIRIEYSIDGGETWMVINQYATNSGSTLWLVEDTPSDNCLMRMSSQGFWDTSDGVFSIVAAPTLTVTSPNGGEQWEAGTARTITWTSTGIVNDVKIDYSFDSGETWTGIDNSAPNTGSHGWTVPDTPSGACLVRIHANGLDDGETIADTSDTAFTITETQVPALTVTAPNGGETFYAGTDHEIKWTSAGPVGNINIDYSTDGGETWLEILYSTENDGIHLWTVPQTSSSHCLVRVSDSSGTPQDASDAEFSIISPSEAVLTVTSPNGGETWPAGFTFPIEWGSTGTLENVSIEYSTDNGITWKTIALTTANDGSFDWTVPVEPSEYCLVRVQGKDMEGDGEPFDVSDRVFSIVSMPPSALRVTAPNGGETWKVGSTKTITWTVTGNFDSVSIQYSVDNGDNWITIGVAAANDGSYNWQVPDTPSAACRMKIIAIPGGEEEEVADVSDGVFSITL